jgi:lipopolysaccharide/colanic/teichoic acid biosynthesis glycosyltransferase
MLPAWGAALSALHGRHRPGERVLIVGSGAVARTILRELDARPNRRPPVLSVSADGADGGGALPGRCLRLAGGRLSKIIEDFRPDRIIVCPCDWRGPLPVQELLEPWARGIVVEDGVAVCERLTGKIAIEAITPGSCVFSKDFRKSRLDAALRRAVSLSIAAIGLLLTAPLCLLIAVLIKLESAGPALFVSDRVGAGGRRFRLLKFRTMKVVTRRTSEWVRDNGDRITRVGFWLRKYRLDELPQFVNVLRGDMDVVGPRPHPVSNYQLLVLVTRNVPQCGDKIPFYTLRSLVRPGITGWAQVRYGYANDVEEETEKIRFDLYYVKHRSLWLDLRILLETIRIVLLGHGADRVVPGMNSRASAPAMSGATGVGAGERMASGSS